RWLPVRRLVALVGHAVLRLARRIGVRLPVRVLARRWIARLHRIAPSCPDPGPRLVVFPGTSPPYLLRATRAGRVPTPDRVFGVREAADGAPARLVVLVSGSGTNLQALLDACADPTYGVAVVAVGADRDGIEGLARAERAGVPTFLHRVKDFASREDWDAALTASVASYRPDLVV